MYTSHTGVGCMTSRTFCLIIGWIEVAFLIPAVHVGLVGVGFSMIGLPCDYQNIAEYQRYCDDSSFRTISALVGFGTLVSSSLCLVPPCLLLHGVNKGKASLLVPQIVFGVVRVVVLLAVVIAFVFMQPHFILVIPFIQLVIESYKTFVVFCHYKYLLQKPNDDTELLVSNADYVKL